MKAIKSFQIALIILVLSIAAGCSDQVLSPDPSSSTGSSNKSVVSTTADATVNSFTKKIRLNAKGSYRFNYWNTELIKFNSINAEVTFRSTDGIPGITDAISGSDISANSSVDNLKIDCRDISVYSSNQDPNQDVALNCKSSGFNLSDITIANTSSGVIEVNVILTGVLRPFNHFEE